MERPWPHTMGWPEIDIIGSLWLRSCHPSRTLDDGSREGTGRGSKRELDGGFFSKPPAGKYVMVSRSLAEGERGQGRVEMFNPLHEDVL